MTIKQEIKKFNLTGMEEGCLESLIDGIYHIWYRSDKWGFSVVDATDIAEWSGINIESVKGVLTSLMKKGLIEINDNGVYLRPEHYNLHSREWVDEYRNMFQRRFESTESVSEH